MSCLGVFTTQGTVFNITELDSTPQKNALYIFSMPDYMERVHFFHDYHISKSCESPDEAPQTMKFPSHLILSRHQDALAYSHFYIYNNAA